MRSFDYAFVISRLAMVLAGSLSQLKWRDLQKPSRWSKRQQKLITQSYSHSNGLMTARSKYVYMLLPICAQNFVMRTGTPHMQNFWPSSPYTYGDSPFAYGNWFATCQQSFFQSCVEAIFLQKRTHTHIKNHCGIALF